MDARVVPITVLLNKDLAIIGDDYWVSVNTGDWVADCKTGRDRAERVLWRFVGQSRDTAYPIFRRMMHDLVAKGEFGGVEVGFFQRLLEVTLQNMGART